MELCKNKNKGFTLIELLIAMAIFVTFTGLVVNSYMSIVKSQREANDYRLIYAEARGVFERLTDTARDLAVYYPDNTSTVFNGAVDEIIFMTKDSARLVKYDLHEGKVRMTESINCGWKKNLEYLNSDGIEIEELNFFVTPAFNPYLSDNVLYNSLQFQPKVTVFARFRRGDFRLDLQTTVSSRVYSALPEVDFICLPKNEENF